MKNQIVPTVIAKTSEELTRMCNGLKKYSKRLQIDIMDGKFVENKSNYGFEYNLPKGVKYEAHLMVNNPEEWIKKNYKKFDIIIPNLEKVKNPKELIKFVKSKKKKIGFALR